MQGVYRIRNKLDNMRYVGSTNNFIRGWKRRLKVLRRGDCHNTHLQRAWNKYGEENFAFEVEEEVAGDNNALLAVEQGYLDEGFELGILYNTARTAGGGPHFEGHYHTKENRTKMSAKAIERWNDPEERKRQGQRAIKRWEDPEERRKQSERMSGENNPRGMLGKHHTEETKQKTKDSWTPEKRGEQSKRQSGEDNSFYGKHHTEEVKRKQSERTSGRNNPMYGKTGKEHPVYGYRHTEESKRKQSEAMTGENNPMYGVSRTGEEAPFYGRHHTEETKAKMSKAHRGKETAAKPYPAFYNTKIGNFIPSGYNLKKLCEEETLNYQNMANIAGGRTKQTKDGWKLTQ